MRTRTPKLALLLVALVAPGCGKVTPDEMSGADAGADAAPGTERPDAALPGDDREGPMVRTISPVGAAVPTNAVLSISFSEPMDEHATEAALTASPAIDCTFLWSGAMVTCTPAAELAPTTAYTVTLGVGARDRAGNPLAAPYAYGFTTGAAPDIDPPAIVTFSPETSAAGVARDAPILVTFSEPMDRVAVEAAFMISQNGAVFAAWPGTFAWEGATMVFQPSVPFAYGDQIRWRVTTAATDVAQNALPANVAHTYQIIRQGTAVVVATAALDGYVRENGTLAATVGYLNVGDRSDGLAVYGFLSFDSSMIPAGAAVTEAILTVYQESVTGQPYGTDALGLLRVERVPYGNALDASDFSLGADPATTVILSRDEAVEAKSADLAGIAAPCAGLATCQFRVRFARPTESPTNGGYDYVTLSAAESATASQRPMLALTWEYP